MNAIRVVDLNELSHGLKLKLANITGAIAAQLPIINESEIDCGFHFSAALQDLPVLWSKLGNFWLRLPNERQHLHQHILGQSPNEALAGIEH